MKTMVRLLVIGSLVLPQVSSAQWVQTNTGLTNTVVRCFAVFPHPGGTSGTNLYAGTSGAGVFLSTDNGTSWTPVNTGLTNTTVHVFATSGAHLFAGTSDGVFLSADNGANWGAVNSGLPNSDDFPRYVTALAVFGTDIFAATCGRYGGGVFRSTDKGSSWNPVSSGLTTPFVRTLAVSGTGLFAGTGGGLDGAGGVFYSADKGASWSQVGLDSMFVQALAVSGTNLFAGTTVDGVFLSTNNGTSWTQVSAGLTSTNVQSLAVSGTTLFAGTYGGGAFLSTNNGSSWTAVNTGLTDTSVSALAVCGTDLLASTWGYGVWRRPVSSMVPRVPMSLEEIRNNLLMNPPDYCDPIVREQSLLALDGVLTSQSDSARRSPSIIEFYTSMMNKVNYELGYSVSTGASIWMMYNDGFLVKTPEIVFAFDLLQGYSDWGTRLPLELIDQIRILFVSHLHGDHADSSVANKVKANGGCVIFPAQNSDFGNVPMAAGDTLNLLGLHIKTYSGFHGGMPHLMYEVDCPGGLKLLHTGDNQSSQTLPEVANVDVLLLDAWVNESGAATSVPGIRNCLKRLEPTVMIPGHIYELGHPNILSNRLSYEWALAVDDVPVRSRVEVMTWGELYATDDIGTSSVGKQTLSLAKSYKLQQNYPNPFNPRTTIEYQIPQQSLVSLKIFDLLGRGVATLANGMMYAGSYTVNWDASRLASGVYLCRLHAGSFSATKKLILIR